MILDELKKEIVLISDGAMGTELQKRGLGSDSCPEKFNVTEPDIIQSIHDAYYSAGSDIVETNTFGGTRARLGSHGEGDMVIEYNKTGAALAKAVCPVGKYVAGSMGPTGELIQPFGKLSVDEIFIMFSEQAGALAEGGVDVLFVETMMSIEEAETAVRAAKTTGLPVSATMTFELSSAGPRTSWGVDTTTAVERLTSAGADILGSNCGTGMDVIVKVIEEMRSLSARPLLAQPNAGLPVIEDGQARYQDNPDDMAAGYQKLLALGTKIIGGCCGTAPEYISMLRNLLK